MAGTILYGYLVVIGLGIALQLVGALIAFAGTSKFTAFRGIVSGSNNGSGGSGRSGRNSKHANVGGSPSDLVKPSRLLFISGLGSLALLAANQAYIYGGGVPDDDSSDLYDRACSPYFGVDPIYNDSSHSSSNDSSSSSAAAVIIGYVSRSGFSPFYAEAAFCSREFLWIVHLVLMAVAAMMPWLVYSWAFAPYLACGGFGNGELVPKPPAEDESDRGSKYSGRRTNRRQRTSRAASPDRLRLLNAAEDDSNDNADNNNGSPRSSNASSASSSSAMSPRSSYSSQHHHSHSPLRADGGGAAVELVEDPYREQRAALFWSPMRPTLRAAYYVALVGAFLPCAVELARLVLMLRYDSPQLSFDMSGANHSDAYHTSSASSSPSSSAFYSMFLVGDDDKIVVADASTQSIANRTTIVSFAISSAVALFMFVGWATLLDVQWLLIGQALVIFRKMPDRTVVGDDMKAKGTATNAADGSNGSGGGGGAIYNASDALSLDYELLPMVARREMSIKGNYVPRSVIRTLWRRWRGPFLFLSASRLFQEALGLIPSLLLRELVDGVIDATDVSVSMQSGEGVLEYNMRHGVSIVIGLIACSLFSTFIRTHYDLKHNKIGIYCRAMLSNAVYTHAAALKPHQRVRRKASDDDAKKKGNAKGKDAKAPPEDEEEDYINDADVINHLLVDVPRICDQVSNLNNIWCLPCQIGFALYLLYVQIGWGFLAGLVLTIAMAPANAILCKKIGSINVKMMTANDARVGAITEVVSNIKFVKMCGWSDAVFDRVAVPRAAFMECLSWVKYLDGICAFLWASTPVLVSIASFITYAGLFHGDLTPGKVVASLALFNSLILPLNSYPWVLNGAVEAWVSLCRLEAFLYDYVPEEEEEEEAAEGAKGRGSADGEDTDASATGDYVSPGSPIAAKEHEEGNDRIEVRNVVIRRGTVKPPRKQLEEGDATAKVTVEASSSAAAPFQAVIPSLVMRRGALTVITGPAGCGKSTALAGLSQEATAYRYTASLSSGASVPAHIDEGLLSPIPNPLAMGSTATNSNNTRRSSPPLTIAYLPQEAFIMDCSVRRNILFHHYVAPDAGGSGNHPPDDRPSLAMHRMKAADALQILRDLQAHAQFDAIDGDALGGTAAMIAEGDVMSSFGTASSSVPASPRRPLVPSPHHSYASPSASLLTPSLQAAAASLLQGGRRVLFADESAAMSPPCSPTNSVLSSRHSGDRLSATPSTPMCDGPRYRAILDATCLAADMAQWPKGDERRAGDGGDALSGGQKHRVALARALYSDADVYVVDDFLGALDAEVCGQIVANCIGELLRCGKHVVMASEHSEVMALAKSSGGVVYTMKDGILGEGTDYSSATPSTATAEVVQNSTVFASSAASFLLAASSSSLSGPPMRTSSSLSQHMTRRQRSYLAELIKKRRAAAKAMKLGMLKKVGEPRDDHQQSVGANDATDSVLTAVEKEWLSVLGLSASNAEPSTGGEKDCTSSPSDRAAADDDSADAEVKEVGSISLSVCWSYIVAMGIPLFLVVVAFLVAMQGVRNYSDVYVAMWASDHDSSDKGNASPQSRAAYDDDLNYFLKFMALLAAINVCLAICRGLGFAFAGLKACVTIHDDVVQRVIGAPFSFFRTIPRGRLINRLSRDVYCVDESLPFMFNIFLAQVFMFLGAVVVIGVTSSFIVLAGSIPIVIILYYIQRPYRRVNREMKRLESAARSPIVDHLRTLLDGGTIMRCLGPSCVQHFVRDALTDYTHWHQLNYNLSILQWWFNLMMQLIGVGIIALVGIVTIVTNREGSGSSGAAMGLALAYVAPLTSYISNLLGSFTELEKLFISLERVEEYRLIETEGRLFTKTREEAAARRSSGFNRRGAHNGNGDDASDVLSPKLLAKQQLLGALNDTNDGDGEYRVRVGDDDVQSVGVRDIGPMMGATRASSAYSQRSLSTIQGGGRSALASRLSSASSVSPARKAAAYHNRLMNGSSQLMDMGTLSLYPPHRPLLELPFLFLKKKKDQRRQLKAFLQMMDVQWPFAGNASISLSNVSVRYSRQGPRVLKALSCVIPHGQTVALIGRTGSGKSTLILALLGLVDVEGLDDDGGDADQQQPYSVPRIVTEESSSIAPSSTRSSFVGGGQQSSSPFIAIGGISTRLIEPEWMRRHMTVLPQECLVLAGTIYSNLDAIGGAQNESAEGISSDDEEEDGDDTADNAKKRSSQKKNVSSSHQSSSNKGKASHNHQNADDEALLPLAEQYKRALMRTVLSSLGMAKYGLFHKVQTGGRNMSAGERCLVSIARVVVDCFAMGGKGSSSSSSAGRQHADDDGGGLSDEEMRAALISEEEWAEELRSVASPHHTIHTPSSHNPHKTGTSTARSHGKGFVSLRRAPKRNKARIVVMDEPAASIDGASEERLWALVRLCYGEGQSTVLAITHKLHSIVGGGSGSANGTVDKKEEPSVPILPLFFNRVLVMQEGVIVADGAPLDLLEQRVGPFASMLSEEEEGAAAAAEEEKVSSIPAPSRE